MKRIENLKILLNQDNIKFIQNLCIKIEDRDQKDVKKISKEEREKIKEEQVQMIILALKALNTFGLDEVETNFNILEFMSESVLPYLFDPNSQIRMEAVHTFRSLKF
jgi:hypothetical protein